MKWSPDPARQPEALDPLTFGDLCYAIEKRRVPAEQRGASFELRVREIHRWGRRETAFRALLAPLTDCLSMDLGGFI